MTEEAKKDQKECIEKFNSQFADRGHQLIIGVTNMGKTVFHPLLTKYIKD